MHRFEMYSPLREWKKEHYPISPFLYLSVGFHCRRQENILLSAQLMTNSEIDEAVDCLKQELEDFRKKAKEELKSLSKMMRKK